MSGQSGSTAGATSGQTGSSAGQTGTSGSMQNGSTSSQTGMSSQSTAGANPNSVTGCLSGSAASGTYTLVSQTGTTYVLTGNTDKLRTHVGDEDAALVVRVKQ